MRTPILFCFYSNSDRDFYSENIISNKKNLKKITLPFDTNEHQAISYQNTLRYNVITKLS
jgi:hypothetical protein